MKKYLNSIIMLSILFLVFYFLNRSSNLSEGFRDSLVYIGPIENRVRENKFLENEFGSHSIYETGIIRMPNPKFKNKRYSGAYQNSYPGYYN